MGILNELDAVIFDLDNTLVDSGLDASVFASMRREIGIAPQIDILAHIDTLAGAEKERAIEIVEHYESRSANATPCRGAAELVDFLRQHRKHLGVFTRNTRKWTLPALASANIAIDDIVCREDAPPKPRPDGVHHLCSKWQVKETRTLMVGDYLYDIEAGRNAGCKTALVGTGRDSEGWPADYRWRDLSHGLEFLAT